MKIAVYIPEIHPSVGGGFTFPDVILQSLIKCAPNSSHTFLVYGHGVGSLINHPLPQNITLVDVKRGFFRKILEKLKRATNIAQDIFIGRRIKYFKTWFQNSIQRLGVHVAWFVTPVYLECDVPYIFTMYDLEHLGQPWFPETSEKGEWEHRQALYSRAISKATKLLITDQLANEVQRYFSVRPERLLSIPFPTPEFALKAKPLGVHSRVLAKYKIEKPFLLYPAQLWPHKNHVNLLLAVKELEERHGLEFSIVFVGSDKGNLSFLKSVVKRLGLEAKAHFLGYVPIEDLVELYQAAFALAFISFFGTNLPPLEAFALGCPVIASDIPGSVAQLGDAALFVDPKDPSSIAMAVQKLHSDRNLREHLISLGRERATSWTGSDYVGKVFDFFDKFESVRRCWM